MDILVSVILLAVACLILFAHAFRHKVLACICALPILERILLTSGVVAGSALLLVIVLPSTTSAVLPLQHYTYQNDAFSISLTGKFSVKTYQDETYLGTLTRHTYDYASPHGQYLIHVISLPVSLSATLYDSADFLQSSLDEMLGSQSATNVHTTQMTFLGHNALDSTFTLRRNATNYTSHIRLVAIGQREYVIALYGVSTKDFARFVNSFQYVGVQPHLN